MDGSLEADGKTPASYEYNVGITRRVSELAHAVGVSVEGELGCLGSLETGHGEAEDGQGAEGRLRARAAADRSRPGAGFRRAHEGRCARGRDRHIARRLQVLEAADRRDPGDGRDRGDPRAAAGHSPGDARQLLGAPGAAGRHQRVRRRDASDLGRAGRGDRGRHPPRRAQGQHRHRLPHGDDRAVPQGRARAAARVRPAQVPEAGDGCARAVVRRALRAVRHRGPGAGHPTAARSSRWPAATAPALSIRPSATPPRPPERLRSPKEITNGRDRHPRERRSLQGRGHALQADGLLRAGLRAQGHRCRVLLPDHAAGRRRSGGGGGRRRRRELHGDLDRGLDRSADRLRQVSRQVLPGRSGARQSRAALRLHRLRPRPVRAGLDRQPDRLDHRQRVRLQAVEGAPARGHAPARRLREDLRRAADRHRGRARAARQVRPPAARRDRQAQARAVRAQLRPRGVRGAQRRPRLHQGRREHQLPALHALARPLPVLPWRRSSAPRR